MTDVIQRNASFIKTVFDRILGKSVIMFLPGKPFFLRRCKNITIKNNAGCRIMVERRNAKDIIPYEFPSVVTWLVSLFNSALKNSTDHIIRQTTVFPEKRIIHLYQKCVSLLFELSPAKCLFERASLSSQ